VIDEMKTEEQIRERIADLMDTSDKSMELTEVLLRARGIHELEWALKDEKD
jgi:hypothetical protein